MIELIRQKDDPFADNIEQRFDTLVLSYKTSFDENTNENEKTPRIIDGDEIVRGKKSIKTWLNDLESDLQWQRSLSGDGCYIDPSSGEVC